MEPRQGLLPVMLLLQVVQVLCMGLSLVVLADTLVKEIMKWH